MTIAIADLVARIRADTTDLTRGAQDAKQQLQGVAQQADLTARALEIMAEKAAKIGGGTAQSWLENFQRSGAQPTAAALAEAAKSMEQTAAAAQKAVEPTKAAAQAAQEMHEGFRLSESSAIRFGAGIVGIGLGISLAAGAARLVHSAITAVIDSQTEWERGLVRTTALYGALGSQVVAISQAQASLPGVLGSQSEFLQANLAASYLSRRYGLAQSDITQLTTSAGRASYALGYNEQQRIDLQQRALQFAESGDASLRPYGVEGGPLPMARRLGFTSPEALQALTPADIRQAQTLMGTAGLNQLALAGGENQRGLLVMQAEREKALTDAQSRLQNILEGGPATGFEPQGGGFGSGPGFQLFSTPREIGAPPRVGFEGQALTKDVEDARAAVEANRRAIEENTKSLADANAALAKLGIEAGGSAAKLLSFTGSLEDRYSLARGDVGAQAIAAVAARAVGPNPLIARTAAEMAVGARESAEQQAYAGYVAEQARQNQRDSGSAIRQFLTQQAQQQGPGLDDQRASAQRALDDIQRRYLAATIGGQAQQAGAFAQRAQTEGQDILSTISVQQDERRLAVAEQLAGYRRESLQLESQMAPLLLQQATLQDHMVVAARDNLASRRELIAAQQQELRTTQITSAYDYEQRRLELRAEQSRATVAGGGAATEDISALRGQYRATELQRAGSGVDIEALDAARRTQVVGQQRTGEQLGRDETLTNLEQQGRVLQDQLIPLGAAARLTQAKQDTIQRTLALMDLEDTKAIASAQHAVNSASLLAIQAGAAQRAAQDMAAKMDLGATSAERWANAIDKGSQLLKGISTAAFQQADVDARIANGLGAGGIGPVAGMPASTVNRIPGFQIIVNGNTPDEIKTQVHISVEEALNRFFAGASTAGPPAPPSVGGNGR